MKQNQKGFSVVEILIVIVVVGLLGTVGWLVYDRQSSHKQALTDKTTPSSNDTKKPTTPATTTETPKTDPYADWQSYSGRGFVVKYPAKWTNIDLLGDRQDLSSVVFGTHTVAAQGGEVPGTSAFNVSVFHKGYDICDCNPTQYVDENTDLTHFIRSMNGLLPNDSFSQVQKQTKTIDGVEALKFKGGNFDTPWTIKVGSNIYQFGYIQGKDDVDSQTLQQYFNNFLNSFHIK